MVNVVDSLNLKIKGCFQSGLDVDLIFFMFKCQFIVLVDVENDSLQVEELLMLFVVICVGKGYMIE